MGACACSKCGLTKPFTAEFFASDGKRLRKQCRPCRAAATRDSRCMETPERREQRLAGARLYHKLNRAAISERQREWKAKNADHMTAYWKKYYRENKEKSANHSKQWRIENRERKLAANREWARTHPECYRKSKKKRRQCAMIRIGESVSTQIRISLKRNKDHQRWERLVGYTRSELAQHLERQFTSGMSWDNYGQWHIDHVVPQASFSFSSADDPQFRACWALSNLQPLWAIENIRKGAKHLSD